MKQILKDWTLPISMFLGVLGYLLFTQLSFLYDAKVFLVDLKQYSRLALDQWQLLELLLHKRLEEMQRQQHHTL